MSHHPPPGGIISAVTRYRGCHLVHIRALRHAKRVHGTGTVLMITTAEEMIHGTDTGIVGVDDDVYSLGVSTSGLRVVSFCLICLSPYS